MGLTGDGMTIFFRTPGDEKRLALTEGVRISSDGNTVRRNVIVGAFTKAINIDGGDNNIITQNTIGTRADGTVPAIAPQSECVASFNYNPQNWYGGWGIGLGGTNNTVTQQPAGRDAEYAAPRTTPRLWHWRYLARIIRSRTTSSGLTATTRRTVSRACVDRASK